MSMFSMTSLKPLHFSAICTGELVAKGIGSGLCEQSVDEVLLSLSGRVCSADNAGDTDNEEFAKLACGVLGTCLGQIIDWRSLHHTPG